MAYSDQDRCVISRKTATHIAFAPLYNLVSTSRNRIVSLGGPSGFLGSRMRSISMWLNLYR